MKSFLVALVVGCLLLMAVPCVSASPLQTWTVEGSTVGFNDFGDLRNGSDTFLLTVLVDPDTHDLSPGGRAGFYDATATLTLGTIHEAFPVEIGIIGNGSLGDSLQIQTASSRHAPPVGWSHWTVSINFQDTTASLPFTGELPTTPLSLDDFNQSNGSIFLIRNDQTGSLTGTPTLTALQTPEPGSGIAAGLLGLLVLARRR